MPWRGPTHEGEFPSLGWAVLDWIEAHLNVPDGPTAGEPLVLTDEQAGIVVRFYAIDNRGRFVFRRGAVRRMQGWGKSPMLGAIALAELAGPVRFDGWDADGEPVAAPQVTPWVQIAATSEDQTDNTYAAAHAMAAESDLAGSQIDVGLTRMYDARGAEHGRLEAVTAAAGTRLGQRVTFAVLDETHLWLRRNGGLKLAAVLRRNAGKMNGRTFESTNAHQPGEDSVAERTWKAAQQGTAGLMYDSLETPRLEDITDRAAVVEKLQIVRGDSLWVPIERLADEIADPGTDPSDARRYFLNELDAGASAFVDILAFEELADAERVVEPGERIGLGFDGSISDDKTALYGCTVDGFLFEVAVWERPPDAPRDWRVPRGEVHDVLRSTFATYDVGLLAADPAKWWSELEDWSVEYGEDRVEALDTNSARKFAPVCGRFAVRARERSLAHDGKPKLIASLAACAKKNVRLSDDDEDGRTPFVIVKADTRKIDEAVAGVLAAYAADVMPTERDVPTAPFAFVLGGKS